MCRSEMTYANRLVKMPKDKALFDLYCRNIGYTTTEDIEAAWGRHNTTIKGLQISTKHFDPIDIESESGKLKKGVSNSTSKFTILGDKRKWPGIKVPAGTMEIITRDVRYLNPGKQTAAPKRAAPKSSESKGKPEAKIAKVHYDAVELYAFNNVSFDELCKATDYES